MLYKSNTYCFRLGMRLYLVSQRAGKRGTKEHCRIQPMYFQLSILF